MPCDEATKVSPLYRRQSVALRSTKAVKPIKHSYMMVSAETGKVVTLRKSQRLPEEQVCPLDGGQWDVDRLEDPVRREGFTFTKGVVMKFSFLGNEMGMPVNTEAALKLLMLLLGSRVI